MGVSPKREAYINFYSVLVDKEHVYEWVFRDNHPIENCQILR